MGTTTPNLGLYKPATSETGWSSLVNASFDTVDALSHRSTHLIRYVDYVNGDDGNLGLTPGLAYKTVSAAYANLVTVAEANYTAISNRLGVGRIILLPGDHDVGTGVVIDSMRPVEIIGFRAGENDYYVGDSGARIISSSAAVTDFFLISHTNAVGHGCRFEDVHFRMNHTVNTALVNILRTISVDNFSVSRCSFVNGDGATVSNTVTAIFQDAIAVGGGNDDSAWFRIRDNVCTNMQFYKNDGTNHNRSIMDGNVVFYGGTNPMVQIDGDLLASTVSNNNFEGAAVAVQVTSGAADHNVFLNNSGESGTNADTFYDISGGVNNCYFIGGDCIVSDNTIGTWITFGADAWNNLVIGAYDGTGAAGGKQKITDNSTSGANTIWHPDWGIPIRNFTAATVADSSFNPARPPNGTLATTNNGGTRKLWTRVGGAWYSVTVT